MNASDEGEHGMYARPAVAVFNVCRSSTGRALNCAFHCFRGRSEQDDHICDGGIASNTLSC